MRFVEARNPRVGGAVGAPIRLSTRGLSVEGGLISSIVRADLIGGVLDLRVRRGKTGGAESPLAVRGHQSGDRIVVRVAAGPQAVAAETSRGELAGIEQP